MKPSFLQGWVVSSLNIPTLFAIFGLFWAQATFQAETNFRLAQGEAYRQDRSKQTDANFAELRARLGELSNIPYRVAVTETKIDNGLAAANQRIDRLADNILASLEAMRRDVNALGTRVEVLSNKIDAISPQPAKRPGQ